MHQIYTLSHADAMRIIHTLQDKLEKENKGAAIAVVDAHGEMLAFLRTDGCPLSPIANAYHKAYTAAREQAESKAVGSRSQEEGWPMSNFGDSRYVGWGGGVPIIHHGQVVGAVGVSGLPEDEDIALAKMGANLF